MNEPSYSVIIFNSVTHAMKSEKLLNKRGIKFKLIPVPKYLSSDCGVCIRFEEESREDILSTLSDNVEILGIYPLKK